MDKAVVRISDNFCEVIIEWEEGSDWPVPDGYFLGDPKIYPKLQVLESTPVTQLVGDMTIDELKTLLSIP